MIGGIIGAYFGGPAGAQIGMAVGGLIGGAIAPEHFAGPNIGDAQAQTAQAGVPRPVVYGHPAPFAGNHFDGEKKARKVIVETQAGKGGGPITEEEHFILTYAIRICEAIPNGGIIRVWRNGVVVVDKRTTFPPGWEGYDSEAQAITAKFSQKARFYLGEETQLPDPALEAIHGVGNTAYYRGTCYMVVEDDDVTDTGGVVPQYQFEVASAATATACEDPLEAMNPGFLYELNGNGIDTMGNGPTLVPGGDYSWSGDGITFNDKTGYIAATALHSSVISGAYTVMVSGQVNDAVDGGSVCKLLFEHQVNAILGYSNFHISLRGPNNMTPYIIVNNGGGGGVDLAAPGEVGVGIPFTIGIRMDGTNVELIFNGVSVASALAGTGGAATGVFVIGGGADSPSSSGLIGGVGTAAGFDTALGAEDLLWASYNMVVPSNFLPVPDAPGFYYDPVTGETLNLSGCTLTVDPNAVTLQYIEEDIASRCKVPVGKMDCATLSSIIVPGFLVSQQAPGVDVLQPLMACYFHDLPEYAGSGTPWAIRSRLRGGSIVVNLTDDDLLDTGDQDPQTRPEHLEFPGKVSVVTQDPDADYAPIPGTSIRRTPDVEASSEVLVPLAVPLRADERQQVAEKMHKLLWAEAEATKELSLPQEFSRLIPSDPVTFYNRRWLIKKTDYADGEMKIAMSYERASSYSSNAIGQPVDPPDPPIGGGGLGGPTIFAAMNLPSLRAEDNVPGVYLAAQGIYAGWGGCEIYLSTDGGLTYASVAQILPARASIMGTLVDDEPSFGEPLLVHLHKASDALENVTAAQVLLGQNAAALLTVADAAEIIGFETADQLSTGDWEISNITRGQLATIEINRIIGDRFVMLKNAVFLPVNESLAGTTLIFRAVTLGTPVDSNPTTSLIYAPQDIIIDGGEIT